MSHLIKFLKEAHSIQRVESNRPFRDILTSTVCIDDSPEMMDFTADEFCDVPDEKEFLKAALFESDKDDTDYNRMDELAEAIVERGSRDRIDHIVTMLISKAETNMKERATELLK